MEERLGKFLEDEVLKNDAQTSHDSLEFSNENEDFLEN